VRGEGAYPPEPKLTQISRGQCTPRLVGAPHGASSHKPWAQSTPPSRPGALALVTLWSSTQVATRKLVSYACAGRSRGKLWWMPATVLTCKSIVKHRYRGERPIELASSWFPPKCPPG